MATSHQLLVFVAGFGVVHHIELDTRIVRSCVLQRVRGLPPVDFSLHGSTYFLGRFRCLFKHGVLTSLCGCSQASLRKRGSGCVRSGPAQPGLRASGDKIRYIRLVLHPFALLLLSLLSHTAALF